ncbi:PAS domain S-box protein [Mucilaginibacter sp. JRF]|uniref:PAS domain S-box protein n=1 Tax=Mucilaginibacter sp. JRF TaxID=2780088 RepID=UPI00187EBBB4|nr:PAS domain S-box protein [Mucilaginibacter sp. JRF]MBE9584453.1 PAS domain S-box protein [Mucilaginibacter sp. JRF]
MIETDDKVGAPNPVSALIDSLPVAVYICDTNGYITAYNKPAQQLWATTPIIGETKWCGAFKTYTIDDTLLLPEKNAAAHSMFTGVSAPSQELIVEREDGSRRYVVHHPSVNYNNDGEITGITNTLIDITAQKFDENKQAMLAAIVQSSQDAIISKTLDGIITSWNQGAERLFGYTEQEAIGRSIIMLIPYDRLIEEELIIDRVRNNLSVEHFETLRKHKDRHLIPISLTVSPIKDSKGNIIGASKIARDISRQKMAEEQLQHYAGNLEILNSFGKTISEDMDVQGILQKVTDATTQLTGAKFGAFFYNKLNENGEAYMLYTLSGAPKEAFEKLGMPRNTDVFKTTFKGEGIIRVDDITKDARYGKNAPHHGMPKGHLPVVSYMAVPVISKSGLVIGGLLYGHPEAGRFTNEHEHLVAGVASQAAIALDNAKLYEEVRMLNAKKDEFIGLASHELKTPVTSINGYLQIIERSLAGNDRNTAFVTKARMQVSKLSALIADLLDVSKIITGKLPLSYTVFNLQELLLESVDVLQQTHISHAIQIEHCDKPILIKADQQRIEQVIINLLSNAVKYSPDADKVLIKLVERDGYAVISVQDFGIGIPKDEQERIFSRFYRVDNIADHISGLGIGLYICNEIISRHQGRLRVSSELGKGSTFSFELPIIA